MTIIHGDALNELRKLPSASVDLVLTDPPYNVGYKYATYKDALSDQQYLTWQLAILRECERVLKQNGSLFYLNYPEFNSRIYTELLDGFALKPIEIIAWVYHAHTSGKPLRKAFRTWIWASKGTPPSRFTGEYRNPNDKRIVARLAQGRKPNAYDWWLYEQVKNVSREKTSHPCQLPLQMVRDIVEATTEPGAVVLDCFAGSFTTGAAAKELGRHFIGIESDAAYVKLGRERLGTVPMKRAA